MEIVHHFISRYTAGEKGLHKCLSSLSILFSYHPSCLGGMSSIIFIVPSVLVVDNLGREDIGCGEDLIEVLELLSCLHTLLLCDFDIIDILDSWESVDDEATAEDCFGNIIVLNGERSEQLKCFKF